MGEWRYSSPHIFYLGARWRSASRPCRFTPGTHWLGPSAGLHTVEKRKIYWSCRESNPGRSARSPSLFRLSYPGYSCFPFLFLFVLFFLLTGTMFPIFFSSVLVVYLISSVSLYFLVCLFHNRFHFIVKCCQSDVQLSTVLSLVM
jgi:hypothetical protein